MDEQRSIKLMKSKLVTVSSTNNDGFAPHFPPFIYTGSSKSKKTNVEVSFPSYRENLMFYEHYNDATLEFPTMLSFMYLGRNQQGAVNYNFKEYKNVEVVDFSMELISVSLIFQIVNQLPKCREIRIFLDDQNILQSSEDAELIKTNRYAQFDCTSNSVRVLKVFRSMDTRKPTSVHGLDSRLTHILFFAYSFLPNLEVIQVEGMDGGGHTHDLISTFCQQKRLPKHNITMKDGRTFCEPESQSRMSSQHQTTIKRKNLFVQCDKTPPVNARNTTPSPVFQNILDSVISTTQPRISKGEIKSKMKMETATQQTEESAEIIEVPVPPKVISVVEISDEENESSASKKAKMENVNAMVRPVDTSSPASTASISSMSPHGKPNQVDAPSSLTSISAAYNSNNNWESSSDEEPDKAFRPVVNPSGPSTKSELPINVGLNARAQIIHPVAAAIDSISTDELRRILNNAGRGVSAEASKKNVTTRSTLKNFQEGIHYSRRPHKRRVE